MARLGVKVIRQAGDERTVVVEHTEKPMMDLMRSLKCEVIPCPFDRVSPFGRRISLLHRTHRQGMGSRVVLSDAA
jgi:hypothetical protein